MFCKYCGNEIEDGTLFCQKCGKRVNEEAETTFCRYCGNQIEANALFCPKCGKHVDGQTVAQSAMSMETVQPVPQNVASSAQSVPTAPSGTGNAQTAQESVVASQVSPKSRTTAALLAFFLGYVGVHRFYVGKVGTGILQILLSIVFVGFIWAFIDFIIILCGNFKDKDGKVLAKW